MRPRFAEHRAHVDRIVDAALAAADPRDLTRAALATYPPRARGPAVIAVGKAGAGMYGGYCGVRGAPAQRFVLLPRGGAGPQGAHRGDHPIPSEDNTRAAGALKEFVGAARGAGADGFVLLLSGGASALMALPVPGLTLADLAEVTGALLTSGADIRELNWVRKHLEQLKGGRLAALMAPLPVDVYVLSDVMGDDLAVIGSGPAWPDGSTFADALDILNRRKIASPAARRYLEEGAAGEHPDTPKPGDPVFRGVRSGIVGNNDTAVSAARAAAAALGFREVVPERRLSGEALIEGALLARALPQSGPAALITGGETTVRLGSAKGVGGRSQELALAAAVELERLGSPGEGYAVAAVGTDGVDGPTDAAGAVVTPGTVPLATRLGLDPQAALAAHDSHTFFASLDRAGGSHLLRTGPTGTNVNDLAIALVY